MAERKAVRSVGYWDEPKAESMVETKDVRWAEQTAVRWGGKKADQMGEMSVDTSVAGKAAQWACHWVEQWVARWVASRAVYSVATKAESSVGLLVHQKAVPKVV